MCEMRYYIDYVLAFRLPANIKAAQGTICHKALELIAKAKLAQQQNLGMFFDDELKEYYPSSITPEQTVTLAYNHFVNLYNDFDWSSWGRSKCLEWVEKVLNTPFDPRLLNIHAVEQYFEIELEHDWAEYSYKLNDKDITGKLAIKGSLDLIVKKGQALEIVDYKTGAKMNWAKMAEKKDEDFYDDFQLLLYHYAASKLYPEYDDIFITIYYINSGGPVTLHFTKDLLSKTEKLIRQRFYQIKNMDMPNRIYPSWKCNKLCKALDLTLPGSSRPMCHELYDGLQTLGMDKITAKYSKDQTFLNYGGGGGKTGDSTSN